MTPRLHLAAPGIDPNCLKKSSILHSPSSLATEHCAVFRAWNIPVIITLSSFQPPAVSCTTNRWRIKVSNWVNSKFLSTTDIIRLGELCIFNCLPPNFTTDHYKITPDLEQPETSAHWSRPGPRLPSSVSVLELRRRVSDLISKDFFRSSSEKRVKTCDLGFLW